MAGGAVHIAPYTEVLQLIGWFREHESYVAACCASSGWDFRTVGAGVLIDLTYFAFVDLALSDNGQKKMEALTKINEKLRGRREPQVIHATILPDEKPVNERD
jgi:hypothetical protein